MARTDYSLVFNVSDSYVWSPPHKVCAANIDIVVSVVVDVSTAKRSCDAFNFTKSNIALMLL